MQSEAKTVNEYLAEIPADRAKAFAKLRTAIKKNLPKGFKEEMNYGMLGYVVPHSLYPKGYHCDPKQPLPFICLASQKNTISFYHMGIYGDPKLYKWFTEAYAKAGVGKIDIGKSCVRFKDPDKIPFALIGELCSKMTVENWVSQYESVLNRKK